MSLKDDNIVMLKDKTGKNFNYEFWSQWIIWKDKHWKNNINV